MQRRRNDVSAKLDSCPRKGGQEITRKYAADEVLVPVLVLALVVDAQQVLDHESPLLLHVLLHLARLLLLQMLEALCLMPAPREELFLLLEELFVEALFLLLELLLFLQALLVFLEDLLLFLEELIHPPCQFVLPQAILIFDVVILMVKGALPSLQHQQLFVLRHQDILLLSYRREKHTGVSCQLKMYLVQVSNHARENMPEERQLTNNVIKPHWSCC